MQLSLIEEFPEALIQCILILQRSVITIPSSVLRLFLIRHFHLNALWCHSTDTLMNILQQMGSSLLRVQKLLMMNACRTTSSCITLCIQAFLKQISVMFQQYSHRCSLRSIEVTYLSDLKPLTIPLSIVSLCIVQRMLALENMQRTMLGSAV